jgi:hypothetical protein
MRIKINNEKDKKEKDNENQQWLKWKERGRSKSPMEK